ncbi:AT-HOOK MOTIF NUCLEAR-LOCALIZED PROTEIN 9 [Salix viminalis]|uniref:AT-hook motif nuclear-localized protein n=1 Tax=Salix viminalis TaxID=40686 RepID=A0A6N2KQN1_SALVM|nr:AT-HOOK MOTIF NUCLEAR-LOCALIZED PROTEIN 9 [Salix viminalis]
METTVSSTSGGGGVTVVGSDAPSDYQIAPRSENNPNSTPGSAPPALPQAPPPNPPSAAATMSVKKKRGRPRKYGPDGSVVVALSPKPISSAAPALSSPVIDFSAGKQKKIKPMSKAKYELENLGEWVACSVGANFTPHIITVNAGEDVTMKVISFSQQGPRAICILSANGVISSVTLRQPDSSGGTLTYEGRFEILSLSGSFMPTETGGTRSRSGGMSVSLASPDGRVVGGGVAGLLVAASPVQVVVGSFLAGNQHEQKPKKQKHDSLSGVMLTAAIPISSADPKINFSSSSFRGDSWSSLPPDSRNKPADINVTLPAGQ